MHQRGLQQMQREHGYLGVLAVRSEQVAVVAVADDVVAGVPVLHDLQPAVHLAAQRGIGEMVAGEDRAHGPAELLERLVGGVLGPTAGEPAQDLLGLGSPEPQGGGVADHLVVLLGNQLPADGAGQGVAEVGVGAALVGAVEPDRADVLQPRRQPEPQQIGGGVFVSDPALGFPAGTGDGVPESLSWQSTVHGLAFGVGMIALIAAFAVFALAFAAASDTGWSRYSVATGIAFVALGGLGAGLGDWRLVALAIALGWSWAALVAHRLRSEIRSP